MIMGNQTYLYDRIDLLVNHYALPSESSLLPQKLLQIPTYTQMLTCIQLNNLLYVMASWPGTIIFFFFSETINKLSLMRRQKLTFS